MLRLSRPLPSRQRENTIALINIVFLMLIFFLIAGSLAPPLERGVNLISTASAEHAAPPDALFVTREGDLRAQGQPTDPAAYLAALKGGGGGELKVQLAADRELPAIRLVEIVGALRAAGAQHISILTERSAQ